MMQAVLKNVKTWFKGGSRGHSSFTDIEELGEAKESFVVGW